VDQLIAKTLVDAVIRKHNPMLGASAGDQGARRVDGQTPDGAKKPPETDRATVILGRVVEAGDIECLGRPGLVISTTMEQLRDAGSNLAEREVEIRVRAKKEQRQ
jgi:hypothetical protein